MKHTHGKTGGIKISPDISWRQVGDEAVLLNTCTSEYYSLNPSGVMIWGLLSKGVCAADIVSKLSAEFGISEAAAKKDMDELLKTLKKEKIILSS